ncbi:sensor histidine kinase [Ruminococcus bicirculans (ex Wegman et al. 2014)]|uniref:sensor histidine kinase n=1 Tax=Ruminococcus bicirculans (ex Wegman et al. 2014) TaxID=1160721 RepID=UPI00399391B4
MILTSIYTTIFVLVSFFNLINIDNILKLISDDFVYQKAGFIAVGLQLIFSGINGYCRFTDKYLPLALISSLLSYSLIFACALIFHKKKKRAIYVSAMFLIIDSIMQSLSCIILELFSINYNQTYLTKGVSVIFNIISLLLVTKLQRKRKNMIRSGLKIIPDHLYVLILVALLLSGEMFGCIPIDFERVKIRNNIINFSAVLIVPIFMVLIIYLLFNCISKQYFENISLLMEKQVEQQVEHYKKINKLTDDLREFRHDYKNHMICLQSLLNNKQYDEALSYVKSITNQEILDSNKFFSGNQIADAILTDKNELAQKNNCKIIFDGSVSDEISVSNLCTILSNALDNSIEACSKIDSDETQIIDVKCVASELIQIIRISNPNLDNNAVTETSKADRKNHGFGLSNIRRTVERMDGQMIISSQYPTFVLEIEFKVK